MDWQERLITLYLWVCNQYEHSLQWVCERHSFHVQLHISDEEVLTVYLFGLLQQRRSVRQIHTYAQEHLSEWFPFLPSYAGFVQRLNGLVPALSLALERLAQQLPGWRHHTGLLDSMPIILAQGSRRFQAKVAPDLAGAGYCPSKKLFYYGLKLHCLAQANPGTLPTPQNLALTAANVHDLKALPEVLGGHPSDTLQVFADKAYHGAAHSTQGLIWHTPPKKTKGEKHLDAANKLLSTAISKTRQPIESFFNSHFTVPLTAEAGAGRWRRIPARSSPVSAATAAVGWRRSPCRSGGMIVPVVSLVHVTRMPSRCCWLG